LVEGLRAVGYREPDQIELIARITGGDPSRVTPMATELVERNVDVLFLSVRQLLIVAAIVAVLMPHRRGPAPCCRLRRRLIRSTTS
jgi:hypothetical protein